MNNLSNAVAKTMNFVFADIEEATNEKKKRLTSLKAHIGKIATIPLDEIETNENIRQAIDTNSEGFLRLVESIKRYGILENVVAELRINSKETDYKLVCIAGHRRILAAKAAQTITKVPCLLQAFSQKGDHVGAALAENLNREDLHCLDVADGYKELIQSGWTEKDLASHFCRDIRTVKHYLKMGNWSAEIKDLFRGHPNIFSTRVIMRQFAYKKFTGTAELKNAVKGLIAPKSKVAKPKKNAAAVAQVPVFDKKIMKAELRAYLAKQNILSSVIKEEITRAFVELKLI